MDADIMWFTGARCAGSGKFCFIVSYVLKKAAATTLFSCFTFVVCLDRLTTRCTTDDNASQALVNALETSGAREALGRLETRFYGVYRKEEEVYGCPCYPACLSRWLA